ncbi:MAG: 2-methylcitrate dehydratase [Gammaproteobacteria bacterium]|jgi:2-methylcitrate dehydratase
MSTIVEQISEYAAGLRYEDLPADVIHAAKRAIVDSIGCALGGYDSAPERIAREIAALSTSKEPATVMVSGLRTSPELATFANGVMVRFLDFNDGYASMGESGHASDSISAILSAAELNKRSGKDVITATVLAYEVFCRICDEVDLKPIGFDHSTVGGMASAAAAAWLFGLRDGQFEHCMQLAIAPGIALYQSRTGNVSMWKGCAYPNASRNAVFAAMLASRGMTGPSPIFEGSGGYFKAVAGKSFALQAFGGRDGQPFKLLECFIKRFPLGQYSQTVVEAALELREKVSSIVDIVEVQIETVSTAVLLMAGDADKWEPANRETADHSMPYTAAVALIHGDVQVRHFDDEYINDPAIRSLTRKIKVKASADADKHMPSAMRCYFKLITTSGETHSTVVDHFRGHYKNPMLDVEIEGKFRGLAQDVLPEPQTTRLLERLWKLDEIEDAGSIPQLTIRPS